MAERETMRLEVGEDGVARLTLDQGERGWSMSEQTLAELNDVATELSEDPRVRAVLLAAEGRAFGLGADISAFLDDDRPWPLLIKRWTSSLHMAVTRLQRMDAPIVVAVHGACAGGVAALIAGCDLVIASDEAMFVSAYTGIGFSPDGGATVMFTRRMGPARARRFLLLNERLDANGALAAGLADEVVAPDQLTARCEELATQLAAGPTRAYGELRRLMATATDNSLETQLELEAQALARASGTADAREGLTAFRQKRRPDFSGS